MASATSRPSVPGLVPSALDAANVPDRPPVTPPPVQGVAAPKAPQAPVLPNAPTVPTAPPVSTAPAMPVATGGPGQAFPGIPPSTSLAPIDPEQSLRGQSILPGPDPRLASVQGDVDRLRGDVSNFALPEPGPVAGTDVSGALSAVERAQDAIAGSELDTRDTDFVRSMALGQVAGLEGPNRRQLAEETFDLLGDRADRDFARRRRDVGRDAATFGRIGSGKVTTDLGTLEGDRERFLADARRGLGIETADKQLSDQLNRLGATLGAGGAFTSEDIGRGSFGLSRAGAESGIGSQLEGIGRASRAEDVGERDFATQVAFDRFLADRARLGDVAGLESQLFNEGAAERGEFRTERDFQDQLARLATDDAMRQLLLENDFTNSAFDREQGRLDQLGRAGFGGVDTRGFGDAASNLGGQASAGTDFIQQLMAFDAARRGTPPIVSQPPRSVDGLDAALGRPA